MRRLCGIWLKRRLIVFFRPEADGQNCRQRTHKIEQTLTFLFSRRPLSAGRLQ